MYSNVYNSNKTQLKNQGKFDEKKKLQIGGKSPLALCCSFLLAADGRRGGLVADGLCPRVARAVGFVPLCQGTLCWGGWGPCRSSRGHTCPSQRVPSPAWSSSRAPQQPPLCDLRGVSTDLALDFAIFSSFIYLGAWEHAGAHRGGQPSTCRASADGEGSRWAGAEVPSAKGSPLSPVTLGLMKMS